MHTMHRRGEKGWSEEYVLILDSYGLNKLEDQLLWEQEVPSSNLGAPTKFT